MTEIQSLTFETQAEWLTFGVVRGWCSQMYCDTHEWIPMPDEELALFDEGEDPCVWTIRVGNEAQWIEEAKAYKQLDSQGG